MMYLILFIFFSIKAINARFLAIVIALVTVNAHGLQGTVVNSEGEPVAGAKIESVASNEKIITNFSGVFELVDATAEIHVTAQGYSHRIVHLHEQGDGPLVVQLSRTVIEQVDVIGLPIHASIIESAMPVAVLKGDVLRRQQAATLGDTLERQPGVNSNFHGHVASTPIIRGLSGPRVLITQNSLDSSDVSRVGPDHAIAAEVSTAKQVEILRGPATLFYGSGAIGGVVNVVDERVPSHSKSQGEMVTAYDSVNNQKRVLFNVLTGRNNWAAYIDGFSRNADNYKTPVALGEEQSNLGGSHKNVVSNSAETSSGFTLGASYLLDDGFVGVAVERLDREYGIPGHSHGGTVADVFADLKQNRYQMQSEFNADSDWLASINVRAAYTDYSHSEIEDQRVGTVFSNTTSELRIDLMHKEWRHWKGGVNFHFKRSKIFAEGEEAFTPPATSETVAAAIMEEKHIGNVLLQMGGRVERVVLSASNVLLPTFAVHEHAGEPVAVAHLEGDTRVFDVLQEFTPLSASLGAVWDFAPGQNAAISVSHSQRAPAAAEMMSFGPHIGTRTYEVGALFDYLDEEHHHGFALSGKHAALEKSNNIDLTYRKHEGDVGIIVNAFLNKIDDYYYQKSVGLLAESGHNHNHEHAVEAEEEGGHTNELPVYLFTHEDADFYGVEAQVIWSWSPRWKASFFSDFVHAELSNGSYLPRTPPMRMGAELDYALNRVSANIHWTHFYEQNNTAEQETKTAGYGLLDASTTYRLPLKKVDVSVFLAIKNILNAEAHVHTSFIKEVAPRPGRNFSVGVRGSF